MPNVSMQLKKSLSHIHTQIIWSRNRRILATTWGAMGPYNLGCVCGSSFNREPGSLAQFSVQYTKPCSTLD
jgi:hypothetical protein